MLMMHLFARVDEQLFAYSESDRSWIRVDLPDPVPWPEKADFALLAAANQVEGQLWTAQAEGVVHYIEHGWRSIGLILQLRTPAAAPIYVPVTLALSPDSVPVLQRRSPEWFEHISSACQGVLRICSGSSGLCFQVIEQGSKDMTRIREAVLASLTNASVESPEERWANRVALSALASFWPSVTADLLSPGSVAVPPSVRIKGIEPLLRHVIACTPCREGLQCTEARTLFAACQGSGFAYTRISRILYERLRLRQDTPAFASVLRPGEALLFARHEGGVVAGVPPTPQWIPVPAAAIPVHWPDEAPFALQIKGVPDAELAISADAPVLTYLSVEAGRVGLLLTFKSEDGEVYYVPVSLHLDRSGGFDFSQYPDVWREWTQRRVTGRLIAIGQQREVCYRVENSGPIGSDVLRAALTEALADEEPRTTLAAMCHTLIAEHLKSYWVGLALAVLDLGRDHATLRYENPPGDMRPFLRHLLDCKESLAGEACPTCQALISSLVPQPDSGLDAVIRLLEIRFRREDVAENIAVLIARPPATPTARQEALATLRRTPAELFSDAIPSMSTRWPITIASRLGAPWSLLAWLSLTRPVGGRIQVNSKTGKGLIVDDDVIVEGWDIRKADRIIGLLISALRNPTTFTPQLVLSAVALAEMVTRHTQALHPNAVGRVLQALSQLKRPALRSLMMGTANRLVKFLVQAELNRKPPYGEEVAATRAQELWSCLASMPLGTRETRAQWLTAYQLFPWIRSVMGPAVAALDLDSPLRPAFQSPIPRPPHEVLATLAAASAEDTEALDSARLYLIWHWVWVADSGISNVVPPVPTLAGDRVDGTDEYLRQFLWGCWRMTGPEAEMMWEPLIQRVLTRSVEPRVENQAWMSAARHRSRIPTFDAGWSDLVRRRMQELFVTGMDLRVDTRPISLLRVLGAVEGETSEFAQAWEMVERAYDAAGIQAERQRCVGILAARSDLADLVSNHVVRARLTAALSEDNQFVSMAALRALLGGTGLRWAVEWVCRPALHRLLWSGDGAFWLQRLAGSDPSTWREWLLNLLEVIASARVPQLARMGELQYRLEALRSIEHLDWQRCQREVEVLLVRRDLDLVRLWLRDRRAQFDPATAKLLDRFLEASSEVGGAQLGRAAELLRQLEARGVVIRIDQWNALSSAIRASVKRAVSATDTSWLLSGLTNVPRIYREALDSFEFDARLIVDTGGPRGGRP